VNRARTSVRSFTALLRASPYMVGGAKSSDDTMSTLCDLLLGSMTIGVDDPPVHRTG